MWVTASTQQLRPMLLSSLERIVKGDSRFHSSKEVVEATKQRSYKKEQQQQRLQTKFDRIYAQRREVVLQERLNSLPSSRANRFSIIGDEYHLRQELLLGHPVDLMDARSGRTCLLEAVAGCHFHLVRMLINEFGANVNCVTSLGKASPLHIAVEFGFRQIAAMLIAFGANVNAKDMFGRTPLHLAKKLNVVKLLMKFPCDASLTTNKGLTPLAYYKSTTPEIEQDPEVLYIMTVRQDKRTLELAREEAARTREGREKALERWAFIAGGGSTVMVYDEPDEGKPW